MQVVFQDTVPHQMMKPIFFNVHIMKTSSDAFLLNGEMQEGTFFSQKKDYFQQRNKHEEKPQPKFCRPNAVNTCFICDVLCFSIVCVCFVAAFVGKEIMREEFPFALLQQSYFFDIVLNQTSPNPNNIELENFKILQT